ncbi:dihydrofolate reductase family protein [Williamsia sp.]|uniref:dihydrofolate reductase family protein n=1 Tax=Williamsia sp. TaxID=1872085 RepID=UPI001A226B55|nr:dihydrofolate reductase family protein [Williamsia sp.]MBJ7290841.1 dihydrofolate reductase family protein [Williamsia sp.]
MRSLVYLVATSIDGFIADIDDGYEAFPFEGPEAAYLTAEFPEMIPTHVRTALGFDEPNRRFDTVVLGRRTYVGGVEQGVVSPYRHLHQLVASRSLETAEGSGVEVVGDPVATVRELKAQPGGDIWLAGGGSLAATLADEIDEIILKIHPLVFGAGIPLFGPLGAPRRLSVTDRRGYESGFSIVRATWA